MIRELVTATRQAVETRMSIADVDSMLDLIMSGGQPSYTGKLVGQKSSMGIAAVYNCVSILADDFATTPSVVYRWTNGQVGVAREQARDHYLWPLLMEEANPRMSAWEFQQTMETWRNLWGNCFAEIEINGRGQVVALWPWRADRVRVIIEKPSDPRSPVWYAYVPMDMSQNPIVAPADNILHIRDLSLDGIIGLSKIELHRQTLGVMLAQTENAGRFYGNGMQIKGALEHPGHLTKQAETNLRASMEQYTGVSNSHRLLILEEGAKYKEVGMKMEDAQFVDSYKLNAEDVARIFKMPAHKIGLLDRATNNNIEQLAIDYQTTTQAPIHANWNGRIHFSLLSTRDRQSIFVEPDFSKTMMADHTARAAYYDAMKYVIAPDEMRQREGYNPLPDELGRVPRVPLNTAPMNSEAAKTGNQAAGGDPYDDSNKELKKKKKN